MAAAMNNLFKDIIKESKSAAAIAHFSVSVRARLEKYPKRVRADIVSRMEYKSTPLLHACVKGKLEMVEYLISTCGADPEQKGRHDEDSEQMAPPLWCATISGKLPVVKCLLSHGCQVDALSDCQTTSLEAACFARRVNLDIVEYLLQHGAKIDRRFHYAQTCLLMGAVCNPELCTILLKHGADIDTTDRDGKTALHHAVELQQLDTVKLLLDNKANPHMRTKQGNDALQAAVLYKDEGTVLALMEHISYPPERLANMYELWGSRMYHEHEDENMTLLYWRKAMEIRNSNTVDGNPLAKKAPEENLDDDAMEKRLCYGYASEFTSLAEVDALAGNPEAFMIQCLLIRERILGKRHKEMLSSIMQLARFLCHDNSLRSVSLYQKIYLWIRALEILNARSTRSFETACEIADGMIALGCKDRVAGNDGRGTEELRFADVVKIFEELSSIFIMTWMDQNKNKFQYKHYYQKMAGSITYVMHWLIRTARTSEDEYEAREHVRRLMEVNPKSIPENDTLLHIYVVKSQLCRLTDPEWENRLLQVTKLMLECGAQVNARNAYGQTPLYYACDATFTDSLNRLLVEHGAHLDTPSYWGLTPACVISAHPRNTIDIESHTTLRCHAARVIAEHKIPCNNLPASVQEFIELHRRIKDDE